ncbi:uncharacterized protein LOC128884133 [Hylaeus volcanicus]|uniref:uncharacterized protein LOC128884133 n=1 Tax=Hylaeus volcanicus TaxID=313075 RepID=UPI0023B7EAFD|nr:uncharacterized protein LOC128884133 [Hylaeus volcanicus]
MFNATLHSNLSLKKHSTNGENLLDRNTMNENWKDFETTEDGDDDFLPQYSLGNQYNLLQSANDFTSFNGNGGFLAGVTQENANSSSFSSYNKPSSDSRTIHPLKIGMIQKYFNQNPQEHRLKCFKEEINMFKLIGLATNVQVDTSQQKWTFTLDDATGIIQVGWLPYRHTELPNNDPSPWMKEFLSHIQNNSYVRVYGDIDLLGHLEPHVSAFFVARLDLNDEIFYHDIIFSEWITMCSTDASLDSTNSLKVPQKFQADDLSISNTTPQWMASDQSLSVTPKPIVKLIKKTEEKQTSKHLLSHPFDSLVHGGSIFPGSYDLIDSSSLVSLSMDLVETLKNMSSFRPNGMSAEELLAHLIGRGLKVTIQDVHKTLQQLMEKNKISQTSNGTYRVL